MPIKKQDTNQMPIEKKIESYFEKQYSNAVFDIDRNPIGKFEIVQYAIQRMFGVAEFCQTINIDYDITEKLYNDYKERLENLL